MLDSVVNGGFVLVFASYYCLPAVFSTMRFKLPFTIAVLYFMWVVLFQAGIMARIKILTLAFYIGILSVGYLLVGEATSFTDFFNKLFYYCMDFLPLIILYQITARSSKRDRRFCVTVIILALLFTFYKTTQELQINPNVTRELLVASDIAKENIGTYDFSYAMGLFLPLFTMLYSTTMKKLIKILYIAGIVVSIYYMIVSQYTICLLASFTVSLYIFIHKTNARITLLFWLLPLIIGIVMFPSIINFLVRVVPSEHISARLAEISSALSSGDFSGASMNARITVYSNALQKFAESPILGNAELGMNAHSTILSVLGHLGVIGITVYVNILRLARKYVLGIIEAEGKVWKFNAFFIYYIIVGLTNPINSALATSMVLWLLIPLIIDKSDYYEKRGITR